MLLLLEAFWGITVTSFLTQRQVEYVSHIRHYMKYVWWTWAHCTKPRCVLSFCYTSYLIIVMWCGEWLLLCITLRYCKYKKVDGRDTLSIYWTSVWSVQKVSLQNIGGEEHHLSAASWTDKRHHFLYVLWSERFGLRKDWLRITSTGIIHPRVLALTFVAVKTISASDLWTGFY